MPLKSKKNSSDNFRLTDEARERIDSEFSDEAYELNYEELPEKKQGHRKHPRLRKFLFRLVLICLIVIAVNVLILFYTGTFKLNQPRKRDYPVRGVYFDGGQGELSWKTLETQNISFAYVRATKGKSYTDKGFEQSWESAESSTLLTGAVHDFDFSANGEKQAKNFCSAMGESLDGRLIPAVDLTASLWEIISNRDTEAVTNRIENFIAYVRDYYGCEVVLICDSYSYEKFVSDISEECIIWCESTWKKVDYTESWDIWQYSNRGKIEGYEKSGSYCSLLTASEGMSVEQFKEKFLVG